MSTPARCDHKRIHRDDTNIGSHNECTVPVRFSTPPRGTRTIQTTRAPKSKGHREKHVNDSPGDQVDFDDDSGFPSSPLEARSHHRHHQAPQSVGSPVTPRETQEEEPVVVGEEDSAAMEPAFALPYQDALQHTPGGTSFIAETPFDGPARPRRDSGLDISAPAAEQHPVPSAQPDTHPASLQQWEHDAMQYELEIDHLRRSRGIVVEELENSTALVGRLQVRRRIHEATAMVTKVLLDQTQCDRDAADEDAREARRQTRRVKRRLGSVLVLLVLLVVAYVVWCWCKSPEMEYIRRRRAAILVE